jgi:hypothetical protein
MNSGSVGAPAKSLSGDAKRAALVLFLLGRLPVKCCRAMSRTWTVPVLLLLSAFPPGPAQTSSSAMPGPKTRVYFIAAEEVDWNYLPAGKSLIGIPPAAEGDVDVSAYGRTYRKAVYREYTDGTFTTIKPRAPEWEHLGVLGPLIRAEVGDVIRVVFKNRTKLSCSLHPHGLSYDLIYAQRLMVNRPAEA